MPPAPPDEAPFSDDEIQQLFDEIGAPDGVHGAIVAVSGGSDSVGLLFLLKRRRELEVARGDGETPLVVATVDHGLRPESAAEAREVAALSERWGFEHVTLQWRGEKPATGLQEAAREARYALLFEEARRRDFEDVVTAHTIDDQAETVLMRLARGSGLKGLGGMADLIHRDDVFLHRPLLGVSRARLRSALVAAGVRWIEDPSNEDPRFLRPRLRSLLPLLAREGLDAPRLADVARKLRRADAAIEICVQRFIAQHAAIGDGEQARIDTGPFCLEPVEARMRVVARAIAAVAPQGDPIGDRQLETLVEAIEAVHDGVRSGLRRNLAGALISVGANVIRISPEPARREKRRG